MKSDVELLKKLDFNFYVYVLLKLLIFEPIFFYFIFLNCGKNT